jgi:hypothetical protein
MFKKALWRLLSLICSKYAGNMLASLFKKLSAVFICNVGLNSCLHAEGIISCIVTYILASYSDTYSWPKELIIYSWKKFPRAVSCLIDGSGSKHKTPRPVYCIYSRIDEIYKDKWGIWDIYEVEGNVQNGIRRCLLMIFCWTTGHEVGTRWRATLVPSYPLHS